MIENQCSLEKYRFYIYLQRPLANPNLPQSSFPLATVGVESCRVRWRVTHLHFPRRNHNHTTSLFIYNNFAISHSLWMAANLWAASLVFQLTQLDSTQRARQHHAKLFHGNLNSQMRHSEYITLIQSATHLSPLGKSSLHSLPQFGSLVVLRNSVINPN